MPEPDFESLLLRVDGPVATLTLNRPATRNAIDDAMRYEMIDAFDRIARDDAVRAVVLTGAGKGFCSGGDVRGMQQRLAAPLAQVAVNGWRRQHRTHHMLSALHALPKPVIAAVNGAATGLGCDLALCCDFVVLSDAATMAMTYVHRGLIPDGGGMYFLPRRVGLPRAKELIFSGRTVAPEEALRIGMADRLAPAGTLLAEAQGWAAELAKAPPGAVALSKTILDQTFELTVEQVFALGSQAQGICYASQDHLDSVAAFLARSAERRAAKGAPSPGPSPGPSPSPSPSPDQAGGQP